MVQLLQVVATTFEIQDWKNERLQNFCRLNFLTRLCSDPKCFNKMVNLAGTCAGHQEGIAFEVGCAFSFKTKEVFQNATVSEKLFSLISQESGPPIGKKTLFENLEEDA